MVSHTTIRTFLTALAYHKLSINHFDIETVFLHGVLWKEIYTLQPEGYVIITEQNKVFNLIKSIYGIKQAVRAWHTRISNIIGKLNFVQSTTDTCLSARGKKGRHNLHNCICR